MMPRGCGSTLRELTAQQERDEPQALGAFGRTRTRSSVRWCAALSASASSSRGSKASWENKSEPRSGGPAGVVKGSASVAVPMTWKWPISSRVRSLAAKY